MEGYRFHTALLGGFRKRDVVHYLSEEKRLQEEALEELRQQQTQLERQLDEARTDGSADRLLSQTLEEEKTALLERQAQLEQQAEEARTALARAEEALAQSREQLAHAAEELSQSQAQQEELSERLARSEETAQALARQLEELRAAAPVPEQEEERRRLLEELRTERQRAAQLESRLRDTAARPDTPDGAEQLWSLCGKMERTIRQMERMLDGPYRVTCYPVEHARQAARPEQEEREGETAPSAEPNGVSSLLRRVRGH